MAFIINRLPTVLSSLDRFVSSLVHERLRLYDLLMDTLEYVTNLASLTDVNLEMDLRNYASFDPQR